MNIVMKKIDTWLSIQRYVTEASQAPLVSAVTNVEIWGKPRVSRRARIERRFFVPRITTV